MNIARGLALLWLSALSGCAQLTSERAAAAPSIADQQRDPEQLIVVAIADGPESTTLHAGSTPRGYDLQPRYGAGSRAASRLAAVEHDYGLSELNAWPIEPLSLYCVVLRIPHGADRAALLAKLSTDARVQLAQPLQQFSTYAEPAPQSKSSAATSSDPYLGLQRGFAASQVAAAQRVARGRGVRIALIDTGVDRAHPELSERIAHARNYVDEDWHRFDADRHGTEVAGVLVAASDNAQGIAGIAPEAQLMVFKACWQPGTVSDAAVCNSFTLAQALTAAASEGAQLINLSLGGPSDPLLSRLLKYCLDRGIVVVAAMPPAGPGRGFPLDVSGVLAVDTTDGGSSDPSALRAPGTEILTLTPGGHYDFVSGSSFAAAFVTGTAALLLGPPAAVDAGQIPGLLARARHGSGRAASIDSCAALAQVVVGLSCRPPS